MSDITKDRIELLKNKLEILDQDREDIALEIDVLEEKYENIKGNKIKLICSCGAEIDLEDYTKKSFPDCKFDINERHGVHLTIECLNCGKFISVDNCLFIDNGCKHRNR